MDRNEFIGKFFRITVLAAIAALVAVFYSKRQISLDEECTGFSICNSCGRLDKCALPEATKFRKNG